MADDKKNPWWEHDEDDMLEEADNAEEAPPTVDEAPPTIDAPPTIEGAEDYISNTPATMKVDPNLQRGGGDFGTPPTVKMPHTADSSGSMGAQNYGSYPGSGSESSFTATPPPTIGDYPGSTPQQPAFQGPGQQYPGFFGTQGLPVMPGTLPGSAPGMLPASGFHGSSPAMPAGHETTAHYQNLQLSELGPGLPYATQSGNLGLLLDVPVPITVVLGRSVMRIQEVLGLQPGSVVTLDRTDGEPVDLLIKDKLIAQGEVVVIDGNYGIKITKIVEPEQRLKDLG